MKNGNRIPTLGLMLSASAQSMKSMEDRRQTRRARAYHGVSLKAKCDRDYSSLDIPEENTD